MVLVVACGHTYTIFLFVAAVIALPVVLSDLRTKFFGPQKIAPRALACRLSLVVVTALTLILPYIATSRSFSSDQFLADGGIERIPLPWVVAFVAVSSAPLFIQAYRALRPAFIAMCVLIVSVSAGIARYSIGEKGYVSYYPTKIIIAMAICMVFAAVTLFSSSSRLRRDFPIAFISLAAAVAIVLPQKPGTVFTTAYMGRMREVLPQLLDPVPLTVNGELDVKLAEIARERQTPILLMSQLHESELNSRWINVLASSWTDESWTGWMAARTQLANTATVSPNVEMAPLIVAADSAAGVATAKSQGFDVCSIVDYSTVATLEC